MSGLGQDPGDVVFFCQVMSPHHPDQISRVQTRSLRRFSIILISFVFDIDILSKYLKIEFSIIFISASMPLFFAIGAPTSKYLHQETLTLQISFCSEMKENITLFLVVV